MPLFQSESKCENHCYENDFELQENETACRTHCHKNGFTVTLVLKQRHKRTRKWPIQVTKDWNALLGDAIRKSSSIFNFKGQLKSIS